MITKHSISVIIAKEVSMPKKKLKSDRIEIALPVPSISIKQFIEKSLQDDDYFASAVENPLGILKKAGINVNESEFKPSDFATFFGALAGLKEIIRTKDKKKLTFERVFGEPAQIRGSLIDAEINQGFCKEWDNKDAFVEKMKFISSGRNFEIHKEICGTGSPSEIYNLQYAEKSSQSLSQIHKDWVSARFESSETWNHTDKDWGGTERHSQSQRGSNAGVSKNFESDGMGLFIDYLRGPLIHPVDLQAISARIEMFTEIAAERLSQL